MAEVKMPKFEKSSESVLKLFDEITANLPGERKKMFGYPCLFLNGNMVAGTFGAEIIFRFGADAHESLKAKYMALRDFSPMPGRVSKGSLAAAAIDSNKAILRELLLQALAHAASLAPKVPKARKHKKS